MARYRVTIFPTDYSMQPVELVRAVEERGLRLDRVADYCDGWMPIGLMGGLGEGLEDLRKACDRAGREYESLDRAIFAARADADSCRANVDLGFTDQLFALPSDPAEKLLPRLDALAELVDQVR